MAGQANNERYKDLDLDFTAHPVTGDVVQKHNKEAVKQSVQNLVRMSKFDKPFRPDIDSRIYRLLFEPDTPLTPIELRKSISDVLVRHEPRISLVEIDVQRSVSDSAYNITIRYQIINTPSIEAVKIQLERLV
jgi:phage baseplate assembly protein W